MKPPNQDVRVDTVPPASDRFLRHPSSALYTQGTQFRVLICQVFSQSGLVTHTSLRGLDPFEDFRSVILQNLGLAVISSWLGSSVAGLPQVAPTWLGMCSMTSDAEPGHVTKMASASSLHCQVTLSAFVIHKYL